MENKIILVENMIKSQVGYHVPEYNARRTWTGKGATHKIPFEELQNVMNSSGVYYLFEKGMLFIHDMDAKIALGLEEEGTQEPTRILPLKENDIIALLTKTSLVDFKQKVNKLSKDQQREVAFAAVEQRLNNLDKVEFLEDLTGVNVAQAIQEKRDDEKAKAKEKKED